MSCKGVAWILSDGNTASTDYYIMPWLLRSGVEPRVVDSRRVHEGWGEEVLPMMVVISRYLTKHWRPVVRELHRQGVAIVYFMDDNLFDKSALRGLPPRYRRRILRDSTSQRDFLQSVGCKFLVSTPWLARRYAELEPEVLSPLPLDDVECESPERGNEITICYHGTASHHKEIVWLRSVMQEVLSARDNVVFELFGERRVRWLYRRMPKVRVVSLMRWPQYSAWSACARRDIALAPLLDGPFNHARGPTKFFDYTRMGAVGVYSDRDPYSGFVQNGVDGVLVPDSPGKWVDAIISLIDDQQTRRTLASQASVRVSSMRVSSAMADTGRD